MEPAGAASLSYLKHPVVWIVTFVRFLAAVYILINPFWGLLLSVIFDIFDATIFLHVLGFSREQYHNWDKVVDWFAYITEFLVAITYGLYLPFFILLFLRFAGQFMFMRSHSTMYFILFPNFFETAFLWLILFYPNVTEVNIVQSYALHWLIIFFILKEIHELTLHYVWLKILMPKYGQKTARIWKHILRVPLD